MDNLLTKQGIYSKYKIEIEIKHVISKSKHGLPKSYSKEQMRCFLSLVS